MGIRNSTLKISSIYCLAIASLLCCELQAQHNNEFYNDGSLVHIQAGAEVHVWGDVHMTRATGTLENNGLLKVQGHMYGDNLFQQRGTGTTRLQNNNVNIGERQKIEGDYSVRSLNSSNKGVNDGSFYNLELGNDQGIVYLVPTGAAVLDKYVADVRNSIDYQIAGAPQNRLVTHNIGATGPIVYPADGPLYTAVFGMMNPTGGIGSWADNTVSTNGNMSGVDAGYVQGKMRYEINPAGGAYPLVLGLEPAGAGAQRGMQYMLMNFAANSYNVIEAHFDNSLSNVFPAATECSGYLIDYWGGTDHGQWVINNPNAGAGTYSVQIWPQDDNFPAKAVWMITKDNAIAGTADQCGPSPVGLLRGGFDGGGSFGVAAADIILANKLIDLRAYPIENRYIRVDWATLEEDGTSHFEVERSTDNMNYQFLANVTATGNSQVRMEYAINDNSVLPNQNYYYRIKTVNANGSSDYSNSVVAHITRESGANEGISIYPNPVAPGAGTTLEVVSNTDRNVRFRVYDAIGQLVYFQDVIVPTGITQHQIPSYDWPAGVYFIQVTGQDFNKVKELVKTR